MPRRAAFAGLAMLALVSCGDQRTGGVEEGALPADRIAPEIRAVIPPLSRLGENALRVHIDPTFSDYLYVVDFAPQPINCLTPFGGYVDELAKLEHRFCQDVLVTYRIVARRDGQGEVPVRQWTFHIPVQEWRNLADGVDFRLDGWRGAPRRALDGTWIDIERVEDGKLRSVGNNEGESDARTAGNPAYFVQLEAQRLILLFGPAGTVPRATDWTVKEDPDPRWPCSHLHFAVPDPDGYGVGDDACARALGATR